MQGLQKGAQAEVATGMGEGVGASGVPSPQGHPAGSRTTTASTLLTRAHGHRTSCVTFTW